MSAGLRVPPDRPPSQRLFERPIGSEKPEGWRLSKTKSNEFKDEINAIRLIESFFMYRQTGPRPKQGGDSFFKKESPYMVDLSLRIRGSDAQGFSPGLPG